MPENMDANQLEAVVETTVFRNEENGYSVISVKYGDKKKSETCVVGVLPLLTNGENVVFDGEWTQHPQYGYQWKATGCHILKPTTVKGIVNYLGSGIIKGIGPKSAKLIVDKFGKDTMKVIEETPERLLEIRGIGPKSVQTIIKSIQENINTREAMLFLQGYGISAAMAYRISKRYGIQTQQIVTENPYRLVEDVDGIGFVTADKIALSLGIAPDSAFRVRAGITYLLLLTSQEEGHTFLTRDEVVERVARELNIPADMVENELQVQLFERKVIAVDLVRAEGTVHAVQSSACYYAEKEIAFHLNMMMKRKHAVIDDIDGKIARFEKENGIEFSPNQCRAAAAAAQNGLTVITGGPGTGKTTIINCVLSLLKGNTLLAAPTGRAAKRMSEATGRKASTIHRLLEYDGETGRFKRGAENPLDAECIIVDEMSMVDIFLMRSLLCAARAGTRMILVGDADQLPSVGAGNVLDDIIKSNAVPVVRLTDIFRQAASSMIVVNAHRINRGEYPILNQKNTDFFFEQKQTVNDITDSVVNLCVNRLPKFLHSDDPARDIQVLSPVKRSAGGVSQLNTLLQQQLNPPAPGKNELLFGDSTVFREGDKVMHIKNNYDLEWTDESGQEGNGVFNGDIGYIRSVDKGDRQLTVLFEDGRSVLYEYQTLEELTLAYCLTVHKSQGSEFPCVVMPVTVGSPRLFTRNLFYTALTRAKKAVVLVGTERAIHAMVDNVCINRRNTTLSDRLQDGKTL